MHNVSQNSTSPTPSFPKPTSGKRKLAYVLGGCGCLALLGCLFLFVALFAIGSMSNSSDRSSTGATTVHRPSDTRQKKAQQVAETYLDHIAAKEFDAAWRMASKKFRDTEERSAFDQLAASVQEVAEKKPRHLVDRDADVSILAGGEKCGVQKLTYEYRKGRERRAYRCVLRILDSELTDEHDANSGEDFQILAFQCAPIFIQYRKGWGGEIPERLENSADSLENLVKNGWPAYDRPGFDQKSARTFAQKFQRNVAQGQYRTAYDMYHSRMREKITSKRFEEFGESVRSRGLGTAKLTLREAKHISTRQTWLNDDVGLEAYTFGVVLPKRAGKQTTIELNVIRTIDYNTPAAKRSGAFSIGGIVLESRR